MADLEADSTADKDGESVEDPKQDRRIITLVNGDQTVVIEGPDDLQSMGELAAYFWLLTSPPQRVTLGFGAGSTLYTERAEPYREDEAGETCP